MSVNHRATHPDALGFLLVGGLVVLAGELHRAAAHQHAARITCIALHEEKNQNIIEDFLVQDHHAPTLAKMMCVGVISAAVAVLPDTSSPLNSLLKLSARVIIIPLIKCKLGVRAQFTIELEESFPKRFGQYLRRLIAQVNVKQRPIHREWCKPCRPSGGPVCGRWRVPTSPD